MTDSFFGKGEKLKERENNRKKMLPACILAALLLLPSLASARVIDGVVALVNDEPITYSEVRDEVAAGLGMPLGDADVFLREQDSAAAVLRWVNTLVETSLVRSELKKRNQSVPDREIDQVIENVKRANNVNDEQFAGLLAAEGTTLAAYRNRIRMQIERGAIIRELKFKEVTVTDDEAREFFRENSERFVSGGEIRLEALFFPLSLDESAPDDTAVRARYAAFQVMEAIRQDQPLSDGLEVARAMFPEVESGAGDFVPVDDLSAEIRQEIGRLGAGERSAPFPTEAGIYIIRVIERRGGTPLEFSPVRDSLVEELTSRRSEKAMLDIIADLKRSASIDIRL